MRTGVNDMAFAKFWLEWEEKNRDRIVQAFDDKISELNKHPRYAKLLENSKRVSKDDFYKAICVGNVICSCEYPHIDVFKQKDKNYNIVGFCFDTLHGFCNYFYLLSGSEVKSYG
jgi:hypothetical protein